MEQFLSKSEVNKLEKQIKNLKINDEFEIMFGGYNKSNSMTLEHFNNVLNYLKKYDKIKKLDIEYKNNLDICYNYDNNEFHTYRITIDGNKNINNIISLINNRQNNIIYSIF